MRNSTCRVDNMMSTLQVLLLITPSLPSPRCPVSATLYIHWQTCTVNCDITASVCVCVCGASTVDTSLLSNIQKLFSEKIEIFSPVDFSKVSVLTGIIKISLKVSNTVLRSNTIMPNFHWSLTAM